MKIYKHNIIWLVLLCTTVVFSQKQTKEINEKFKVNKGALIEINTRNTDVEVIVWNKNEVSIEGVLEVDGLTKEDATKYFESWNIETSGDTDKIVITSRPRKGSHIYVGLFDDFKFDFEPLMQFEENFKFEMPELPEMPEAPEMPTIPEMPELPKIPEFPEYLTKGLSTIDFDHEAFEKDKEGYMKKFEEQQKVWEEKFQPQMKEFEEKMKKWEKENEPRMKEIEEKMKKWEKENEPKMKKFEAKMKKWEKENEPKMKELEEKMEKMEQKIAKKYADKMKEKGSIFPNVKSKVKLVIKVPKNAVIDIDSRHGTITLPDNLNTKN